ncbi:MAG: hypothetical protein ABI912_09470 [Actinomycetota bacterium]
MSADRSTPRRRVRRRTRLLEEITDEVEPDEGLPLRRRLAALLLLIAVVGVLAAFTGFVIVHTLSRGH